MHILWFNDEASLAGGCEHYIRRTVAGLNQAGVKSTLLYDPQKPSDSGFLGCFAGAFPNVDTATQLRQLKPDLLYVHQLASQESLSAIRSSGIPSARFFHDHRLFCPRDYKYTALRHQTCTRRVGMGCYPCLGFVRRSPGWPGIKLSTVGALLREQQASMFFDAILTASRYMASHVADHGFDRNRVHVIPLFADIPSAASSRPRVAGQLLFVGQLIRGKGIDILLKAMSLTRNPCQLLLAGDGKQRQMFEALTRQLGLEERVRFLGKRSTAELAIHYSESSLVVFPSRSPETFGLVGLEAMTHGTPVVATAVGGVGEWLQHEVNGLSVPSGDSEALARALDQLLADPDEAKRMGAAGRRMAEERFQPQQHIDRLLELFSKLTKRPTPLRS